MRTVQYLSCAYNVLSVFSSGLSDVLASTYSDGLDVQEPGTRNGAGATVFLMPESRERSLQEA